jgi:glycosyltransferase involved in cell wall biosynthesis
MNEPGGKPEPGQVLPIRVGLFFTFEVSLATWDKTGILNRELALYRKLAEAGIHTTMFTYGNNGDLEYAEALGEGITSVPLMTLSGAGKWSRFFGSWLVPLRFRQQIRQCGLVKTNQMWGAWTGLLARLLLGRRWVLRCGFEHHRFLELMNAGWRDREFSRVLSWIAYRYADAVVWSNPADRDWAIGKFGLKQGDPRFHVNPNYVDTHLFAPNAARAKDVRRIITVGRLTDQKNLEALIEALRGGTYELEIIGEGPDREKLRALAVRLEVKVDFRGALPQDQLPERLNAAGVFVLCSKYEGHPKALLEAMSCGLPVVGNDVDGIREVVEHGRTGLLCGAGPASIREAIDRLAADEGLRTELGTNARRHVENNFSIEIVANNELKIYQKLMAR